jgi:tRNA(Ile)-lysidine synthase
MNPGIEMSLLRTMEHLNEVSNIYREHIREARAAVFDEKNGTIDLSQLLRYPSPESILFELLTDYGFNPDVIREIYQAVESQPGKLFCSEKYDLVKDRNHFLLTLRKPKEENPVFQIRETDEEIQSPFLLHIDIREKSADFTISKEKTIASFDADKLQFPLILRKWQPGDRFVPFGMNGSQKLSDYFNDHKFTKSEKENTWILCSGEQICWIVGHRTDNRFRIEKNCKNICTLSLR